MQCGNDSYKRVALLCSLCSYKLRGYTSGNTCRPLLKVSQQSSNRLLCLRRCAVIVCTKVQGEIHSQFSLLVPIYDHEGSVGPVSQPTS